jgi:phosphopantetheinyl transferase (holo-ACP synthase)
VEQSNALTTMFCPLGCPFLVCSFTVNKEAVFKAVGQMFDQMTVSELEATSDALDERAAILMFENGYDYETAMQLAEADILPVLLDIFERCIKFNKP